MTAGKWDFDERLAAAAFIAEIRSRPAGMLLALIWIAALNVVSDRNVGAGRDRDPLPDCTREKEKSR
jgi:hypothetical protein